MFLLILVNGLSAFYFFVRVLRSKLQRIHFSSGEMTKIGIAFLFLQFVNLVFYLKFQYIFLFIIVLYAPTLILYFVKRIKQKVDKCRFSIEFYQFIKDVSLSMRMGNSFRSSVNESYHLLSKFNKQRVESIMELVVFSQHKKLDPKLEFELEIYKEFLKIDNSSHQAQQRIDLWIEQTDKNNEFRHKSGQILQQLYIQMGIMSCMYIALLAFISKKYGFINNINLILLSLAIFILGSFVCIKIGKKIKWNF